MTGEQRSFALNSNGETYRDHSSCEYPTVPSHAGTSIHHRSSSTPTQKLCPWLRHALHKFCIGHIQSERKF